MPILLSFAFFILSISFIFNFQQKLITIHAFVLLQPKKHYVPYIVTISDISFTVVKWKHNKCGNINIDTALGATNSLNDDSFDIEAVRKRLESLVTTANNYYASSDKTNGWSTDALTSPLSEKVLEMIDNQFDDFKLVAPYSLATIERERKEYEIELLGDLTNGDASIPKLSKLWFNERGKKAAEKLCKVDDLINIGPGGWEKAEIILSELLHEFGVYWVEPCNYLATLYYIQGKWNAAERMCRLVLEMKPWHFGALSRIVLIHAALHDTESARRCAAARLPTYAPIGPNRRRQQWVDDAVEHAKSTLCTLEKNLIKSFGCQDDHVMNTNNQSNEAVGTISETEWQ